MSAIYVDDGGVTRRYTDTYEQVMVASPDAVFDGGANTPSINDLPFDIKKVFYTEKYTGGLVDKKISLETDFVTNRGFLWFKALTESIPHAIFNVAGGIGNMLNLSVTNPVTPVGNNEILSLTKTELTLKGGAQFVNKIGIDYLLMGFVNRKDFSYATTFTHVFGQSEKIPMQGRIANVGMVILKANTANAKWLVWHRSLSNGSFMTLNEAYPKEVGNLITVNAMNEIVIDPNFLSGEYSLIVFGHSSDGTTGVYAGSYKGSNTKINLPFEPMILLSKSIDPVPAGSNTSEEWVFLNQALGWVINQNDSYLNHSSDVLKTGAKGHPLPDGFMSGSSTTEHIFLAIKK